MKMTNAWQSKQFKAPVTASKTPLLHLETEEAFWTFLAERSGVSDLQTQLLKPDTQGLSVHKNAMINIACIDHDDDPAITQFFHQANNDNLHLLKQIATVEEWSVDAVREHDEENPDAAQQLQRIENKLDIALQEIATIKQQLSVESAGECCHIELFMDGLNLYSYWPDGVSDVASSSFWHSVTDSTSAEMLDLSFLLEIQLNHRQKPLVLMAQSVDWRWLIDQQSICWHLAFSLEGECKALYEKYLFRQHRRGLKQQSISH